MYVCKYLLIIWLLINWHFISYTAFRQALIAINAIIEINISYKISINYCSIKMQIVIILSKKFKYSTVRSVSILQFCEHFLLIFDNCNVNNDKQIKQKMANFFSANFSELSNFSSSSFWEKPLWNQKLLLLNATPRSSCYTLVRSFQRWVVFHFFKNFLELIFATKIKKMLLKQSTLLFTSCQKNIAYIMCLNTWLNKNACLNIVLVFKKFSLICIISLSTLAEDCNNTNISA